MKGTAPIGWSVKFRLVVDRWNILIHIFIREGGRATDIPAHELRVSHRSSASVFRTNSHAENHVRLEGGVEGIPSGRDELVSNAA